MALAIALHTRARAHRAVHEEDKAKADFCSASEVLQHVTRRVGEDTMAQAVFRTRHYDIFRDCVEAELLSGDSTSALLRLESGRSRAFLDSLVTRELKLPQGTGPQLSPLSQIDQAVRERNRIQRRLSETGISATERSALRDELVSWGDKRNRALVTLKRLAPEIAALEGGVVDSLAKIAKALPKGGVALEYAVGAQDTLLFAVKKNGPVQLFRIPEGREALTHRVDEFRQAILRRNLADMDVLRTQGSALFALLLGLPLRPLGKQRCSLSRRTVLCLICPSRPCGMDPLQATWVLSGRWSFPIH